jgi:hypothetical protein
LVSIAKPKGAGSLPGISTHVHFARLLLPELETSYNPFYFVLGSVATDCFEQGNDESFRLYHFIGPEGEIDLERFLDVTRITRQSGDLRQQSFIDGYCAHLWLDRYIHLHGDALPVVNPGNLTQDELRTLIRANIEWYDLIAIAPFVNTIRQPSALIESFSGLTFVSLECAVRLYRQLINAVQAIYDKPARRVVIDQDQYTCFLAEATDKFASVFNSLSDA